jgi:hypothetical protein
MHPRLGMICDSDEILNSDRVFGSECTIGSEYILGSDGILGSGCFHNLEFILDSVFILGLDWSLD